ncbi:MAG TPA: PEP-CTERM sorting domain-containing protein, partial [Lacunisphaera sp.]
MGNGAYIYVNGTNNTLTLDSTTTVSGDANIYTDGSSGTAITNAGTITHTSGSGSIYSLNLTNSGTITATGGSYLYLGYPSASYNTTNTGSVTADGSGTYVYLRGPFDNNGTLTAQNSGNLLWDGTNTTANLGSVVLTGGGRARLNGTLNNASATLNAPTGGAFDLYGGTITGGTIATGALGFTTSGGYLDGTTLNGDLNLSVSSSYVRFLNGTNFTGTNATLANNTGLYWQQTGTLSGKTITQGSGSYLYVTGAGNTLTLDPTTTVTGSLGIYTDTSTGTAITNQGVLTHNSGTGYLYANTLVNQGSVAVTGGNLYFGYYASHNSTNAVGGSLTLTGTSNVHIYSPLSNAGQINVQSGTLYTNGYLTNATTGLINGAGTINGGLTLAGGTLAPGNSIGTLTLSGGNFTVTNSSTFAIEMDGTTSDRLTFQSPGTVDIGVGLLQLSINLLAAPTQGTTYTIMNIASGGTGYTGYFAGLPNSGDAMIANFSGTDYTLNVYYLANSIVLQVPEPSTYALLSMGLAVFALRLRRRWRQE